MEQMEAGKLLNNFRPCSTGMGSIYCPAVYRICISTFELQTDPIAVKRYVPYSINDTI